MFQKIIATFVLCCFSYQAVWATAFQTFIYGANQIATVSTLTIFRNADSVASNPASMSFLPEAWHLSSGLVASTKKFEWRGPAEGEIQFDRETTQNPASIIPTFQVAKTGKLLSYGFALRFPFNSSIRWDDDWEGRGIVQEIKLQTVALNPNIAIRPVKNHAIALGVSYVLSSFYAKRASPAGPDRSTIAEARGRTYQWNVSYLGKVKSLWIGAHYHSLILPRLNGTIDFDAAGTELEEILPDEDITVRYNLPWVFEFSLGWKNADTKPTVEFELGIEVVGWSNYQETKVLFEQPVAVLGEASVTRNHYQDTRSFRGGLNVRVHEKSTLMFGFKHGERAIKSRFLSPTTPVGNQLVFGLGHQLHFTEKQSLSTSYGLIIFPSIATGNTVQAPIGGEPFIGTYEGIANIAAVTYHHSF